MSHIVLSDDLIFEVLSFLNLKSLMRFKSVSKPWNTLISNPAFVKLRSQRSASHLALTIPGVRFMDLSFLTVPLNRFIKNPSTTIPVIPYIPLEVNDCKRIIGSCNGLLCLCCCSSSGRDLNTWFCIWNPTTNTISQRLGYRPYTFSRVAFGYDISTATYKVVVLSELSEVKILNLRNNRWRTISRFPRFHHVTSNSSLVNEGVYLSGTVNWFAIQSNLSYGYYEFYLQHNITVDQFVIISLDLGTETYMQLSLPGVDEVPYVEPTIAVLMDCLCFSYNLKGTYFVIWQMTEFGVEQSWTQLLKISFQNLPGDESLTDRRKYLLFPLCLSENGHTLILASTLRMQLIIYNLRDNRVEKTIDTKTTWYFPKYYVESLASIC